MVALDGLRWRFAPAVDQDSLLLDPHNCQEAMGRRVLMDTRFHIPAFYAVPSTVLGTVTTHPPRTEVRKQGLGLEIAAVQDSGNDRRAGRTVDHRLYHFNIGSLGACRCWDCASRTGQGQRQRYHPGPPIWSLDELEPYCRGGKLSLRVIAASQRHRDRIGSTAQMDWASAKSSPISGVTR